MYLPSQEIEAGPQMAAVAELLIQSQVERLGTQALVWILTTHEFETVDEIVSERVTRRKELPGRTCPVQPKAPPTVPDDLDRVRVQQPLVDFRPVGNLVRESGQPLLDQSPDFGISRR